MPVVKLTEMYDLSTTTGRLGLIGIHTPTIGILERKWPGFLTNFKYFRILSCSVRLACASLLPADPLQVSVSGSAIAPQDIMNPILYRAVSNESWNAVVNRIYRDTSGGSENYGGESNSVRFLPNAFPTTSDTVNENLYYALLSEDGWRKAMPQSGLTMKGLKPFVFEVVNTYGNSDIFNGTTDDLSVIPGTANGGAYDSSLNPTVYLTASTLRGSARPYPRLPCTRPGGSTDSGGNLLLNSIYFIPKSYVSCIVLPPSKLKTMYFRMIVDWYVEFQEPCSTVEKTSAAYSAATGGLVYSRSYSFPSPTSQMVSDPSDKVSEEKDNTIDSVNVEPVKVMDK